MRRFVGALGCAALAACVQGPRPVVIDTDMGTDDMMGILYLLQRPEIAIKAITVTGAGLAHCEQGMRNALSLVELTGHSGIPVACGRESPLQGTQAFPAEWRADADNAGGVALPAPAGSPSAQTAPQILTSTIEGASQGVTLLALGPLTNVAEALQTQPKLANRLENIWIMGGAFLVPGNIRASGAPINNDAAEWNVFLDPFAAAQVLANARNIRFVPLDVTNLVPMTRDFFNRLADDRTTPAAAFVHDVLALQLASIDSGRYYFWDPLAAAALTDSQLITFQPKNVTVTQVDGVELGRTAIADPGTPVLVGTAVDGTRFQTVFLDGLNGRVAK
jgi:pyrimidine-specific ribonucleoside hydrolase